MNTALIVIGWLACGLIGYGLMFAFYQREFRYLAKTDLWRDFAWTFPFVFAGPINLLAALIFINIESYKGFKFLPRHEVDK